jgi:3'(2'), 5'-bisphosphate nucleotidase
VCSLTDGALLVADFSAQAVVNTILRREFPQDPIVGEEDAKDLRGAEAAVLRGKVVELANSGLDTPHTEDQVPAPLPCPRRTADRR